MFPISNNSVTASNSTGSNNSNSSQKATVQLGESTLEQVAHRLNLDPEELLLANPQIKDPWSLKVGQDIYMPLELPSASPKSVPAPVADPRPAPPSSNPGPKGDPVAAGVMKANLSQKTPLPPDEQGLLNVMGEDYLRHWQGVKKEVADAHKIYKETGQIPQTKTPFAWVEIKEGRLMSRGARYDAYMASQNHDPANLTISDLDTTKQIEFLTPEDFREEYRERLEAAKKDYVDSCPTKWHSTSEIENCQAKITEKYFGQSGSNQYRKDMAQAKKDGQAYQQHIESTRNGGIISLAGRGIDRLLGGDGETGAAIGGWLDTGFSGYAGYKGKQQSYDRSAVENPKPKPAANASAPPKEPMPAPDPVKTSSGGGGKGSGGSGSGGTGGTGGSGGGKAVPEYQGPTLKVVQTTSNTAEGVPTLTRQQATMIADLRAGRDVIVRDVETARKLLKNMPDLRPHDATGNDPWETAPRGTYRGDLVNTGNPAADNVHTPGTAPDAHVENAHYNIRFPNGERAAIIISPR